METHYPVKLNWGKTDIVLVKMYILSSAWFKFFGSNQFNKEEQEYKQEKNDWGATKKTGTEEPKDPEKYHGPSQRGGWIK